MGRAKPGLVSFDIAAYERRTLTGSCYICAMLAGEWDFDHEMLYEDEAHIGYLSRYPTMVGYALVAPKAHIEHVLRGFTEEQYLRMMAVVRRIGLAVEAVVGPERTYLLSLGSQQGNSHVHWHIAPLPPDVPYREQQLHALDLANGMVDRSIPEQAELAAAIRAAL
jgi:histidine triad (HIT) family protein